MTARPKRNARERLLNYLRPNPENIPAEDDPNFMPNVRRLLRLHERELAERAVRAGMGFVVDELCDCPGRVYWADQHALSVVAAILGPHRRRSGGGR